jgi:hypothetical protein
MPDFFSEPKKNSKRPEDQVSEFVDRTTTDIQRLRNSFAGLKSFTDKKEAPPAYKSNNEAIAAGFEKTIEGLHVASEKVADAAVSHEEAGFKK